MTDCTQPAVPSATSGGSRWSPEPLPQQTIFFTEKRGDAPAEPPPAPPSGVGIPETQESRMIRRFRSAITGRFIRRTTATRHPDTGTSEPASGPVIARRFSLGRLADDALHDLHSQVHAELTRRERRSRR